LEYLTVETKGTVCVITISRPPVNAMNVQMYHEINEAFTSVSAREDVNAVVLRSGCDRAFLAGADLKARLSQPFSKAGTGLSRQVLDPQSPARDGFWAIYDCAVPVIAAVNGAALGAGLAVASVCDIIVASRRATFGLTEIDVGLLGGAAFLARLVGEARMRKAFYTAERIPADVMYSYGAVGMVVEPEELDAAALSLAGEIARRSPVAVRMAKASFNRIEPLPLKEAYMTEQDYTVRLSVFRESGEAMSAFVEHRSPQF
jgi:enoyl-CoA hydratase